MKIVIAPDSFKGNMSAYDAAVCIERGIKRVFPKARCIKVPMADGGEGTVACLLRARGGAMRTVTVCGPARRPVRAGYGILEGGRTAVIEMAAASGLPLTHGSSRNPLKTTSYGTGELIKDAIDTGAAAPPGFRRVGVMAAAGANPTSKSTSAWLNLVSSISRELCLPMDTPPPIWVWTTEAPASMP